VSSPAPSAAAQDASSLAALIREESAAEIKQLLADAAARAERLRATAAAEVESIRSAAAREGEQRGQRRAAALLAVAEAQSRLRILRVREAHIAAALARATTQLASLTGIAQAGAVVASLIREALQAIEPGPVRVRLAASQAALLDDAARRQLGAGRWALRFESAPNSAGGVVVETDDGRLRFDNSITARVRRRTLQLRQLAAAQLWPPAESESRP
jgi:V/A-type H+-transporting ATPase subunit E